MTDYTDPATAGHRLSNAEREEAVSALERANADGRITAAELSERSSAARSAVTRGDLAPLFADLPQAAASTPPPAFAAPSSAGQPFTAPPPGGGYNQGPGYGGYPGGYSGDGRPARGGRTGNWIVAIMPFVALALFFICGTYLPGGYAWSWIFFLAIPVAAIVVYGPGGRNGDR